MTIRLASSPPVGDSVARLQEILRGPTSARRSSTGAFEAALLQVWREKPGNARRWARAVLTEAQLATIEATQRRNAALQMPGEVEGFLLQVFEVLPDPVVMSTGNGWLWNGAFAHHLRTDQIGQSRFAPSSRFPVLRRFTLLTERGHYPKARRVLVPLGDRAWRARLLHLPGGDGVAVYLSHVRADLGDLPPDARVIGLYKASGLTHKEIAHLCDRSKSHVDHVSVEHRSEFRAIRSSLCHAEAR